MEYISLIKIATYIYSKIATPILITFSHITHQYHMVRIMALSPLLYLAETGKSKPHTSFKKVLKNEIPIFLASLGPNP